MVNKLRAGRFHRSTTTIIQLSKYFHSIHTINLSIYLVSIYLSGLVSIFRINLGTWNIERKGKEIMIKSSLVISRHLSFPVISCHLLSTPAISCQLAISGHLLNWISEVLLTSVISSIPTLSFSPYTQTTTSHSSIKILLLVCLAFFN